MHHVTQLGKVAYLEVFGMLLVNFEPHVHVHVYNY